MAGQISPTPDVLGAINPEIVKSGFGSYLGGILPDDIATACGALRQSMLQVRNIRNVPLPKLAQAVVNLETMRDLAVNGTSVPTNVGLATGGYNIMALGSGPQFSYTVSDFFGCMSGLPYNGIMGTLQGLLQDRILSNIYREMYLAVTWRSATVNVTVNETAVPDGLGNFDYFYQVTGITLTDPGGGYSRGTAPPPQIIISGTSGATATVTGWALTTNDGNIATFGRIQGVALTAPGANTLYGNGPSAVPPPSGIIATIESPPLTVPGVIGTTIPTGYTNSPPGSAGWPGMNAIVQNYINQANTRIAGIAAERPQDAQTAVEGWNNIGLQLKREQRARETAFYPLPSPKDPRAPISLAPTAHITWVDALTYWAQNTKPHMYSQTIEAIANWTTVGGQSIVGLMRQERNAARLLKAGIPLDNNIPVTDQTINLSEDKTLIGNGPRPISPTATVSGPLNGLPATLLVGPTTIGASDVVDTSDAPFANLGLGNQPIGYYDSNTDRYVITDSTFASPPSTVSPQGPGQDPNQVGRDLPYVDMGDAIEPGSFAGSPYTDLIDPPLNSILTTKTLTPSTYTVDEAVTEIEKCNCDCWDQ